MLTVSHPATHRAQVLRVEPEKFEAVHLGCHSEVRQKLRQRVLVVVGVGRVRRVRRVAGVVQDRSDFGQSLIHLPAEAALHEVGANGEGHL